MSRSGFSAAMSAFESPSFEEECARARRLLSGLFGEKGLVRFNSFRELNDYITAACGFAFVMTSELKGTLYFQIFYRTGNVWVRLKDQPRGKNKSGHMAVVLAVGDTWDEEVCKFTRHGQLIAKQGFIRRLHDNRDFRSYRRVASTAEQLYNLEDSWADLCHFNLPDGFDWKGAERFF